MSGPLADLFFWIAVAATGVAHVFILRSTFRGMRIAARGRAAQEWAWALLPALVLVALFVVTWRTMHPDTITLTIPPRAGPDGTP